MGSVCHYLLMNKCWSFPILKKTWSCFSLAGWACGIESGGRKEWIQATSSWWVICPDTYNQILLLTVHLCSRMYWLVMQIIQSLLAVADKSELLIPVRWCRFSNLYLWLLFNSSIHFLPSTMYCYTLKNHHHHEKAFPIFKWGLLDHVSNFLLFCFINVLRIVWKRTESSMPVG